MRPKHSFAALALITCCISRAFAQQPASQANAPAPKPSVSGAFKGNGKDAKIAFVSARWTEPFNDKPGIKLVFTEMDHTRDPKADFNAHFGRYGSALLISLHPDGGIFGCEIAHSAHRGGFSSIGTIKIKDFKFENGFLQGQLTTGGPDDVFGQTWEVDLKFSVPLAGSPPPVATTEPPKAASSPAATNPSASTKEPGNKALSASAVATINPKDLILPDATDIDIGKLVKHIKYKHPFAYKPAAAEVVKKLTAQGWKIDGADRVAANPRIPPKSYILNATRGPTSLTIFVKPDGPSSTVTIMTTNLTWDSP